MPIYENIARLCAAQGISITELERKAGVGSTVIQKMRDGRSPRADTLKKIAAALEVSIDALIG